MSEEDLIAYKDYASWCVDCYEETGSREYMNAAQIFWNMIDRMPAPEKIPTRIKTGLNMTTKQVVETFGEDNIRLINVDAIVEDDKDTITKLKPFMDFISGDKRKLTEHDIETAKNVDIRLILNAAGYEINRGFAKCVFHNDHTPSMKVYSNNSVYCFSCGASGDNIKVHGAINGLQPRGRQFWDLVQDILDKFS